MQISSDLVQQIQSCRICADRFAATKTGHAPRPVVWFRQSPRILIAGQAPGKRVHDAGIPFHDRSGDRLRDWLGIGAETFYDRDRIAIVPMAFCFPGYDAQGADLPPPRICGRTWHSAVMNLLGEVPLTIIVGGYAHRWHLGATGSVTDTVTRWRDFAPHVFPLPHPSWRNTAWLKKNPWFAEALLPQLRATVAKVLE